MAARAPAAGRVALRLAEKAFFCFGLPRGAFRGRSTPRRSQPGTKDGDAWTGGAAGGSTTVPAPARARGPGAGRPSCASAPRQAQRAGVLRALDTGKRCNRRQRVRTQQPSRGIPGRWRRGWRTTGPAHVRHTSGAAAAASHARDSVPPPPLSDVTACRVSGTPLAATRRLQWRQVCAARQEPRRVAAARRFAPRAGSCAAQRANGGGPAGGRARARGHTPSRAPRSMTD